MQELKEVSFCTEYGAEDITILKDGLAFFSSVRGIILKLMFL